MDSATPISYKTGIFRQSEYIFYAFFALFPEIRHISISGLLDPLSWKAGPCCPGEVDTFHQIRSWSDHPLPRYDTFYPQYVTLWPWRL